MTGLKLLFKARGIMDIKNTKQSIEKLFRNTVQKDHKIHNAYLLVHSDKLGIHLNISEGSTNSVPTNENQPYYIASVGRLCCQSAKWDTFSTEHFGIIRRH